jgi:hypothetical protein
MYTWADQFSTYADACRYYGVDTPEQMEAERNWEDAKFAQHMHEMEAAFGPYVAPAIEWECPF